MGRHLWLKISIFLIVAQCTYSTESTGSQKLSKEYLEGIIQHVNSVEAHWEAGHNFEEINHEMVQQLLGTLHEESNRDDLPFIEHIYKHESNILPPEMQHLKEFNGLKEWSKCPSVKKIKNQGKCASDWAVAPVSAISDRICIASKFSKKIELSPHELLSCCKTCGWGCRKGFPQMVYKEYVTKGLVTGGDYKSKQGCQPYEMKPCKGNFKNCFLQKNYDTPKCKPYCYNSQYKKKYSEDRNKGYSAFKFGCPCCVVGEIAKNGPLTATMKIYEDFLTYKKGIYHHVTGKHLGFLTVKLVGFNDNSNTSYYIAVNSWGKKWGDKGTFKIRRKVNECMIEGSMRGISVEKDDSSSEED